VLGLESCSDLIHEDYANLLCKFEFINSVEVLRENTCLKSLSFDSVSVADPGCLSRIPDPDFSHPGSRIPKNMGR
jgi:hypothetical protein